MARKSTKTETPAATEAPLEEAKVEETAVVAEPAVITEPAEAAELALQVETKPAAKEPVTYKVKVTKNFTYVNGRFQELGKVLTLTSQQYANLADAVEIVK